MPWGLKRFHRSKQFHFITFSCYRRQQKLGTAYHRGTFEQSLEQTWLHYDFAVAGYVVMPEHVHLLISEPERETLARAMQSLKQSVARRVALRAGETFWQARTCHP